MIKYFTSFKISAFRFESLQLYSVEEERESYKYFLEYWVVNHDYHKEWYDIIENACKRWAVIQRVHTINFRLNGKKCVVFI